MSLTTHRQLDLLRSKISLAMGPSEHNMAYHEVKSVHPDALAKPWSTDMSGPYNYAGKFLSTVILLSDYLVYK